MSIGTYQCMLCSEKFENPMDLDRHDLKCNSAARRYKGVVYRCVKCSKEFELLQAMHDHIMMEHPPESKKIINFYHCRVCGKGFTYAADLISHVTGEHSSESEELAKRDPVSYRYDILYPQFLQAMAAIAWYGGQKYGDHNWQKSRLTGANSPMNHIMMHWTEYVTRQDYDHIELGTERKWHLAAIAFNAMMEFWYESES